MTFVTVSPLLIITYTIASCFANRMLVSTDDLRLTTYDLLHRKDLRRGIDLMTECFIFYSLLISAFNTATVTGVHIWLIVNSLSFS